MKCNFIPYTFISNVNRGKYLSRILVPGSLGKKLKSLSISLNV